jgi:hypothetical protein
MEGFHYNSCPLFPGPEYKAIFMSEVFDLIYHGGGGFSYDQVYNMPIPHRHFFLKKINEHLKKIEELRNQDNQIVTENTNMSKFKLNPDAIQASKDMQFISKVRPKNK